MTSSRYSEPTPTISSATTRVGVAHPTRAERLRETVCSPQLLTPQLPAHPNGADRLRETAQTPQLPAHPTGAARLRETALTPQLWTPQGSARNTKKRFRTRSALSRAYIRPRSFRASREFLLTT